MITNSIYHSQDLSSHQWKDRLILIIAADTNVELYQKQIIELLKDEEGLTERRVKIYNVTPNKYSLGLKERVFIQSNILYQEFKEYDSDFEVVLIGLDGEIKLRKKELLTINELFVRIDGMPMRRQEIMEKEKKG